ncbi:MAG: GntR family transcriptional regulator [bacterium]
MMQINIVATSEIPIYKQIYEQISRQILLGDLPGDYCLPSIRSVALELRISVITIKKAWEDLENDGLIYTVVGKGCFVAAVGAGKRQDKRDELAAEKMKKDIAYYKGLGFTLAEIHDLVSTYYDE